MIENTIPLQSILFYVFAALAVISAVAMISFRNSIYSALSLILTFISISAIYLLLNAQFLALVNVVVYAGAIMVLFVFIIMLTNLHNIGASFGEKKNKSFVYALGGGMAAAICLVLWSLYKSIDATSLSDRIGEQSNIGLIEFLGQSLFTKYIFPFELTGILFLIALIGAVILGKK